MRGVLDGTVPAPRPIGRTLRPLIVFSSAADVNCLYYIRHELELSGPSFATLCTTVTTAVTALDEYRLYF